jgi:hypothetical protein
MTSASSAHAGLRAHRGEIAQVYGERTPADVGGVRAREEVHTFDDGVDGRDELRARRHAQDRGVVADAQHDVVARGAAACEEALDQRLFRQSILRHAARSPLLRAQLARRAVEDGVHELVSVLGAEAPA